MKTLSIGRSRQCDIIVPHDNVSRIHGRISIVDGKYVYEDVSRHGSYINGQLIQSGKITIAPGAEILLAGKVPLPWGQIYSQLPLKGNNAFEAETNYYGNGGYYYENNQSSISEENIAIGWGILAFLIPIAGWIMYFVWHDNTPKRASQANILAWVGFFLNLISIYAAV